MTHPATDPGGAHTPSKADGGADVPDWVQAGVAARLKRGEDGVIAGTIARDDEGELRFVWGNRPVYLGLPVSTIAGDLEPDPSAALAGGDDAHERGQ